MQLKGVSGSGSGAVAVEINSSTLMLSGIVSAKSQLLFLNSPFNSDATSA